MLINKNGREIILESTARRIVFKHHRVVPDNVYDELVWVLHHPLVRALKHPDIEAIAEKVKPPV